jgi:hypothetical protein
LEKPRPCMKPRPKLHVVGSLVVVATMEVVARHLGLSYGRVYKVHTVGKTEAARGDRRKTGGGGGSVSVSGADGVELASCDPLELAEPIESGWLLLHCAIAFRCEAAVVLAVLEANKEVGLC